MKLRNILCALGALLAGVLSANAQEVTRFIVTEAGGNNRVGTTALRSGVPTSLRITAVDADGAIVASYNKTVTLTFAEPRLTNGFLVSTMAALSSGVADNVAVTPIHAGTGDRRITVTDGNIATYDAARRVGDANGLFTIQPSLFAVTQSGSEFPLGFGGYTYLNGFSTEARVRAYNADGTTAETYRGIVTLRSNRGTAVNAVTLTSPGSGYTSAPTVTLSGGGGSGATAIANATITGGTVTGVTLVNAGDGYTSAPTVTVSGGGGSGASVTAEVSGSLTALTVTNPGEGYVTAPDVIISGGGGSGATAVANISGGVTSFTIDNTGAGYGPTVAISGGGGSGATAKVVVTNGAVTGLVVTNAGTGYTSAPTVTFTGGTGSGAAAAATITSGRVTALTVTSGGTGYGPAVTISGGGGSGAAATATVEDGILVGLTVTSAGLNYTSTPTVTISGGGGAGAAATAVVSNRVIGFSITNPGAGYTSAPTVIIEGVAQATATISGYISALTLTSGGAGYTSAPTVTISGGGGSGGSATASVDAVTATITGFTVTSGGSGYTSAPTVTISGGGGSAATAVATTGGTFAEQTVVFDSSTNGIVDEVLLSFIAGGIGESILATDGLVTTADASGAFNVVTYNTDPATGTSGTNSGRLVIGGVTGAATAYPGQSVGIKFSATNPQSGQAATNSQPYIPPTDVTGPIDFIITARDAENLLVASVVYRYSGGIAGSVSKDTTANFEATLIIPDYVTPGAFTIKVSAAQSASGPLTVAGLPDLAITRFDYTPGEYRGGAAMRFDMTWRNLPVTLGNQNNSKVPYASAYLYRTEIHLSSDDQFGNEDDVLVWQGSYYGNNNGSYLLRGQSVSVSDEFLLPKNISGSFYLLAKINSAGGREGEFSTSFTEVIGPAVGSVLWDGNNVVVPRESAKITLLPEAGPETKRVSLADDESQSAGLSDRPVVSEDGRYVVFHSYGGLAGTTTSNVANIFRRDTLLDITVLASPGSFNGGANGHSMYPRITGDARYVVFQSDATNLLPGDTNGYTDIFVRDINTGTTTRLLGPGSVQANQSSFLPDMSGDGRFIVFESTATNLVPGVSLNGVRQIFLYDRDVAGTGTLDTLGNTGYTLVSKTAAGIAANGVSSTPRISKDGSYVVFTTRASNLLTGSTAFTQVVRWSRATGEFVTVSANTSGALANGDTGYPVINRDGSYIVYASRAKNLTSDPYSVGVPHLFRARVAGGVVTSVVRINGSGGVEPNNPDYGWINEPDLGSFEPAISDDGMKVAFVSESTNLLPSVPVHHIDRTEYQSTAVQNYEDRTEAADVYVTDISNPTEPQIFRASVSSFGYESTAWSVAGMRTLKVVQHRAPAMSGDGGFVVFSSDAKGHNALVFGPTNFDYVATNAVKDIYLFNGKVGLPITPTDRPVVSLVLPVSNVSVFESQTLTLAAEVSAAVRSIAQVEFYANGNLIGTVSSPTSTGGRRYEYVWDISQLGLLVTRAYAISVVAVDSAGLRSEVTGSIVATVQINTPPAIAITNPVSGGFVSTGKEIAVYANATDSDGTVASVEFFANGTSIGTSSTAPYKVAWTPGVAGDYILTASATDNLGAISVTASPVTVFAAFQVRPSPLLDSSEFINGMYADLLNREPTAAEFDDAIVRFGAETVTRAEFVVEMEAMAEFKSRLEKLTAYKVIMGVWPTREELQSAIDSVSGGGNNAGDDHGNNLLSATTVTSTTTSGRLEAMGDIDFFRLNVTAEGSFTFSTSGSTDTVGVLYDSAGNVLAEDDQSGSGNNFSITRALTPGTYYVSVESWLGWFTGSYTLRATGPGIGSGGTVASTDVQLAAFITSLFNSSAYQNKFGALPSLATATNRITLFTQFFVNNYGTQPTDQQKLEGSTNLNALGSAATYVAYMVQGTKISGRDLVYNAPNVSVQHRNAALIAGLQQIRPVAADVQPLAAMTAVQAAQAVIDDVDYVNRYITVDNPPLAQTVDVGGTFRLAVDARGEQPFSYQWYRNGAPLSGATSQFLSTSNASASQSGYYSVEITNPNGSVFSQPALVTVGTNTTRVVNLSTRAPVGSGDQTMIAGFVVSGTEPRQMLIRAAGPALVNYGLTSAIADPKMTLFQGNTVIAENDNWSADTAQADAIASVGGRVGAFTFKNGSKDAALLVTLQPGLYTAQVTGADGGSGIGLVEVYDTGSSLATRAANVSTRAAVKSGGDELVIAGFIINGTSPRKVLVRAVGPGLASYGVSGVLADPQLTIHRQSDGAILYRNGDWGAGTDAAGIAAAAAQVGAFELVSGSKDAAIVLTLAPGAYTAQATSQNGGTGVVLVEVYDLEK